MGFKNTLNISSNLNTHRCEAGGFFVFHPHASVRFPCNEAKRADMSTSTDGPSRAPRGLVIAAFVAIYLIWGSTYLGIRFAVETQPPFLMGGARFLTAGLMLYAWLRFNTHQHRPHRISIRTTAR